MKTLACLLALGLWGCQSSPALRASASLPSAARASPERYIVLTVRNPVGMPTARAASSMRGYDNSAPYLAGGVARTLSHALARDYRLRVSASWPIALLQVHCLVFELPPDAVPGKLLAALAGDPRVESVQPLQSFSTAAVVASATEGGSADTIHYNDPYAQLQHNVQQLGVIAAHSRSRGAGVRVAVIDTGVQLSHPDLPPTLTARNFVDNDAQLFAADAHGTAMVGIIAAVPDNGIGIVGIAPDAAVLAYKACWRGSNSGVQALCNTFTLAQALAAAIEAHADLINLSLAGPRDPLLTRLVERALSAGIIVVGAVPPGGARDAFPTNIPGVLAADAMENAAGKATQPAPMRASALVRPVLYAPGHDVLSLAPGSHYDFYSGSSLAAAEITGVIALLRAQHEHLTASATEGLLRAESASIPNACVALDQLLHQSRCGSAAH